MSMWMQKQLITWPVEQLKFFSKKTIEDTLLSDEADNWRADADSEHRSSLENKTQDLVELPPDREAISYKWVLKLTTRRMDILSVFKACLVPKGMSKSMESNMLKHSCCLLLLHKSTSVICSIEQHAHISNWCCDNLPAWEVGRRNLKLLWCNLVDTQWRAKKF